MLLLTSATTLQYDDLNEMPSSHLYSSRKSHSTEMALSCEKDDFTYFTCIRNAIKNGRGSSQYYTKP